MTKNSKLSRVEKLLHQSESDSLELKTSFGRESIETLVAFANAKGGTILIGVNDEHEVIGISVSKESTQQWINQVKSATSPSIIPEAELFKYLGKNVVALWVPAYPVKPVSLKGKYFIRRYASNHLMNLEEIANEHLKAINLSWDFAPDLNHSIKDISFDKVNWFVEKANNLRDRPIDDDPLTVIRKFELLRNDTITFGCFLLFGNEPTLSTTIDVGRFNSETIIKDNRTIRNDLFSEVGECIDFIYKHISKQFVITGKTQREEIWEYAPEAVREIVVNMIVHRDYRASADSTIKIHNNRIEFFNPGSLPEGINLDEILSGKSASSPRNKQIASVFKEAGIIEKYGSGIKRVIQIMLAGGAEQPVFELVGKFFKVTLFPIGGGVNEGVNEGVKQLFDLIEKNPNNRAPFYAKELNTSVKNIERWLKQLKTERKIVFRGPPRTGGYFTVD